jgi:hypothetical protein
MSACIEIPATQRDVREELVALLREEVLVKGKLTDAVEKIIAKLRPDLLPEFHETAWEQKIQARCEHAEAVPTGRQGEPLGELILVAERTGGDGYSELVVDIKNIEGKRLANAYFGLSPEGEPRILLTSDADGEDDHNIAVYPLRTIAEGAVDLDYL